MAKATSGSGPIAGDGRPAAGRRVRVIIAIALGAPGALVALWLASFPWMGGNDNCIIGTVSAEQYRQLYRQAEAQNWTVWPGLSDGLFWPSDRGLYEPTATFENAGGDKLLQAIKALSFDHNAADPQLAAAHAVMRSIGGDYVSVFEIPDFPRDNVQANEFVQFTYYLPQRRFAPMCLVCFVFKYTTVTVNFRHNLVANTYNIDKVFMRNGKLKYDPDPRKERNTSAVCPSFPTGHNRASK